MFLFNGFTTTISSSYYKTMGEERVTKDGTFLTWVGSFSALFNALGRIIWGVINDHIGAKYSHMLMSTLCLIASFCFYYLKVNWLYACIVYLYIKIYNIGLYIIFLYWWNELNLSNRNCKLFWPTELWYNLWLYLCISNYFKLCFFIWC